MQPFIVVTNSGYLDFLRELEFETFPEFFDESYDEIENPIERMNTIVKEIKKICSLSLEELHDRYYNIFAKTIIMKTPCYILCEFFNTYFLIF